MLVCFVLPQLEDTLSREKFLLFLNMKEPRDDLLALCNEASTSSIAAEPSEENVDRNVRCIYNGNFFKLSKEDYWFQKCWTMYAVPAKTL